MHAVIVEFTIRPGHFDNFVARVRRQAADSLALEDDCQVFDVCVDDEKSLVLLYEIYRDRAAFDAHLASAHFADFDAAIQAWIDNKRISTFDRLEVTG